MVVESLELDLVNCRGRRVVGDRILGHGESLGLGSERVASKSDDPGRQVVVVQEVAFDARELGFVQEDGGPVLERENVREDSLGVRLKLR